MHKFYFPIYIFLSLKFVFDCYTVIINASELKQLFSAYIYCFCSLRGLLFATSFLFEFSSMVQTSQKVKDHFEVDDYYVK